MIDGAENWLHALRNAIDDLLVQHHGLRHALKANHLPFASSLAEGIALYGEGPLFHLWSECRAVEALRVVWTGKGSPLIAEAPGSPLVSEAPELPLIPEAPVSPVIPSPETTQAAQTPSEAPEKPRPKKARRLPATDPPPPAGRPARGVRHISGK